MKKIALFLIALGMMYEPLHAQFPAITNQPVSRAVWGGGNVTFTVGVDGTGPFTYQWQHNNTNLPAGIIVGLAGNLPGFAGFTGDGGIAIRAALYYPSGVAVDSFGNLFIADTANNRIRKVNTYGIITTVAGTNGSGFSGDGGIATIARLNSPAGVAMDVSGVLFIADSGNNRIRKVDTDGMITTVAGTNNAGYSGDGGPATNADLFTPSGVAVDASGNLFIADSQNNRIRKVDTGGIITTVAGTNSLGFSGDGGPAMTARLNSPSSVAVDASGNLFIADYGNNRIRKVNTNGVITTVAGTNSSGFSGDGGTATIARLNSPSCVAVDVFGNLFIADYGNIRIREVDTNSIITTVAGVGSSGTWADGRPATNVVVNPYGVTVDFCGNLLIAERQSDLVRKIGNTQGPALALNNVSVANAGNYLVVVTGSDGSVTSNVATLIVANSPLVYGTALDSDGSVTLSFLSQPNSTNVVLSATNLSAPVLWQPLSTNLAGPDGDWQFIDTNAFNYQMQFYRSLTH